MSSNDKKLLKEYVSEILREEDALGTGDYTTYGGLGWGVYGQPGALYKAFVEPLTDVLGVVAGKTKEMARRSITLLQIAFEATMTTLIPFLTDSYDEIFAEEQRDLNQIRSEYGEYYKKADEFFGGGSLALAFLAFPGPALLGKFAHEAPAAARTILSVATGGVSDKFLNRGFKKSKGPSSIFDSYAIDYKNLLSEEVEADDKSRKEATLAKKIGSKKFIDAMFDRSPLMTAASKDAQEIYYSTLERALEQASQVLTARSIEDIEKATGERIDAAAELQKIQGPEREKAEQELIKTVKKSIKQMYIVRLENQIKPAIDIFGEDHPYVAGYQEVIRKIKAL